MSQITLFIHPSRWHLFPESNGDNYTWLCFSLRLTWARDEEAVKCQS
jgi:hypothetical protein